MGDQAQTYQLCKRFPMAHVTFPRGSWAAAETARRLPLSTQPPARVLPVGAHAEKITHWNSGPKALVSILTLQAKSIFQALAPSLLWILLEIIIKAP